MRELETGLWVHEASLDTVTAIRMTIARLSNGGLWIHSPTGLTSDLKSQVDALGRVDAIVAPNNAHHSFLEEWVDAFPEAGRYVARGVPAKRPNLNDFKLIEEVGPRLWAEDFDMAVMPVPLLDECVFLHRPSRSLIVTDLVQNYPPPRTLPEKLFLAPMGWKGLCPPPPTKFDFIVRDRDALSRFVDQIRGWSFDRIILGHGDIIEDAAAGKFDAVCERLRTDRGNALQAFLMKRVLNRLLDGGIPGG